MYFYLNFETYRNREKVSDRVLGSPVDNSTKIFIRKDHV